MMALRPGQLVLLILTLQVGCAGMGSTWKGLGSSWKSPRPNTTLEDFPQSDRAERDASPEVAAPPTAEPLVAELPIRGNRSHSPATRMMIEAELKDATAEEREEWIAFLDSVDPSTVPYCLRARRMEQSRRGSAAPPVASSPSPNAEPQVQIASHAAGTPGIAQASIQSEPVPAITPAVTGSAAETSPSPPESEPTDEASESESSGWPKRLRSLNPWEAPKLWPGRTPEPPPTEGTSDRWALGRIPLTLGSVDPDKDVEPSTDAQAASTTPPKAIPESIAIRPGSEVWEDEVFKLISLLEAETSSPSPPANAATTEGDLRRQVTLRLLYLAVNQPEKAQRVISGLAPDRQEFWTAMLQAVSHQLAERPDQAAQAGLTIAQLRMATHRIQQLAPLEIRQLTFCSRIQGFGNYEGFAIDAFSPSQALLLYSEIRNFGSEPTVDGDYRTRIKSVVEIARHGASGEIVDRRNFEVTEDRCRSIRNDYFHSYRLDLPAHLAPGPYLLKLLVEDLVSGKTAIETIPFTVE